MRSMKPRLFVDVEQSSPKKLPHYPVQDSQLSLLAVWSIRDMIEPENWVCFRLGVKSDPVTGRHWNLPSYSEVSKTMLRTNNCSPCSLEPVYKAIIENQLTSIFKCDTFNVGDDM
jgi:hypothetical protein